MLLADRYEGPGPKINLKKYKSYRLNNIMSEYLIISNIL